MGLCVLAGVVPKMSGSMLRLVPPGYPATAIRIVAESGRTE